MGGSFDWLNHDNPRPCPYCGYPCHADFVDVEVGMIQCGPYHCDSCGATQIGPHDKERELSSIEKEHGWYAPDSDPGSSANVVNGKVVTHQVALAVYRDFYPFSATDFGRKWLREHDPYKEPLPVGQTA
jgi:hypothetical protein